MSASGLESTIAVAIDQILRLAPSIRAPIEPVVSRTNATSTVGRAAAEWAADSGRMASANANTRIVIAGFMVLLRFCLPEPGVPVLIFASPRGAPFANVRTQGTPANIRF